MQYLNALDMELDDPVTLCNLGLCLSGFELYKDYAMMALEEAVELRPGDSTIL